MADLVITVPKGRWNEWIAEGDLPGQRWSGTLYEYRVALVQGSPDVFPGERIYAVAHGKLRGWAPLVRLERDRVRLGCWKLIRGGGARACTIQEVIPGFRGFRRRWWERSQERPFPEWRTP